MSIFQMNLAFYCICFKLIFLEPFYAQQDTQQLFEDIKIHLMFTYLFVTKIYGFIYMVNTFYCRKSRILILLLLLVCKVFFLFIQTRGDESIDKISKEKDIANWLISNKKKRLKMFLKCKIKFLLRIDVNSKRQSFDLNKRSLFLIIQFQILYQLGIQMQQRIINSNGSF
ncbi:unnamed protein product [Paramecium sonneborni]|uniref:Transmembrane protein n=1 Tax=Paramecium sonneborni TaxID=65129 RepID=A0A8S1N636_9CILI|nr:unnamed protein product [Paramecium sonneborni]